MDEFKNLVEDWNSIKGETPTTLKDADSLMEKLKKIQRKILFSNLFMSVAFALTFIVLGWVYTSFPDHGPYFYGSLISMFILMIVTMGFSWYQVLFWRTPDMSQDMLSFSTHMIKKLKYLIWMTKVYVPFYTLMLALAFLFYFQDLLADASFQFKLIAYTLTFGWIFGIGIFSWIRKRKKQKIEIIPIIEQLQEIQKSLSSV
ncbi:MAG: hypothetical protein D8M58_13640 [Calditrichaeota bacterium]|nr:MAG: hypothetical protein DWQ03_14880 [Calditrichota bacterium]MBL1206442.1 hypothetical protein [Calditrichota bacterium]NOG46269.1 hypothetical protein [Calditrichota bacterium]